MRLSQWCLISLHPCPPTSPERDAGEESHSSLLVDMCKESSVMVTVTLGIVVTGRFHKSLYWHKLLKCLEITVPLLEK